MTRATTRACRTAASSSTGSPTPPLRDADKQLGFPHIQGFLAAAIRELHSPGLSLPWYSTVGNHDAVPLGCYGHGDSYLAEFAVGGKKLMTRARRRGRKSSPGAIKNGKDPEGQRVPRLPQGPHPRHALGHARRAPRPLHARRVPQGAPRPGPHRSGPGRPRLLLRQPRGGHRSTTRFRIAEDVIGISLDTTDPGGHYEGSIGTAQLRWLERTLRENQDSYAVVFSHHTSKTMTNTHTDPARPRRSGTAATRSSRCSAAHANVLAWVNGHTHKNEIIPHAAAGGRSFWEISTASHVDFPQLARVIELVDNKDGTLSVFTTLVESAAPHRTDFADLTQTGLAALYRELSFNAPGARTDLAGDARTATRSWY